MPAWMPKARWVFGAATVLGLSSTLQAYRLSTLMLKPSDVAFTDLFILNLAYWYVPAALTRPIFRLSHRLRMTEPHWAAAVGVHALAAIGYSVVHLACMLSVRGLLWPAAGKPMDYAWTSFVQRLYLNNFDWALMTYSTIVGVSYAVAYYREAQDRTLKAAQLEARLMETRLRTLEAELHPHFLFNTLHAISTLIHSKPDAADRMISRLSDLLRLTFDRTGAPRITLQEEVEFLQKYLDIEQTRFQDRLEVEYQIDPDTLDAEVPRLILQPLVENAIKHGLAPKPGQGLIRISAVRRDDRLALEVRDNGVGLNARARTRLHDGVGLSNTRDRLGCLYGAAHRLDFSDEAEGLAVRLEIPFRLCASGNDQTASRVA
jgi:two-component system, LytTR family, sensor kinase